MAVLSVGSHGPAVVELQQLLNQWMSPSPHLPTDGQFTLQTRNAVVRYQTERGLIPNGQADDAMLSDLRGESSPGTGYPGIDRDSYPGDHAMDWLLHNTNLHWTGFYLGPAPSHHDTSWMRSRLTLSDMGWGLAPIYVGRQTAGPGSHDVTVANGTIDGQNAAQLAAQAGFRGGSVIYLDWEDGSVTQAGLDYYVAWLEAVRLNSYRAAVYCSHIVAQQFMGADARAYSPWVFRMATGIGIQFDNPYPRMAASASKIGNAVAWQYAQNVSITIEHGHQLDVDLNVADCIDPSSPLHGLGVFQYF